MRAKAMIAYITLIVGVVLAAGYPKDRGGRVATWDLTLKGTASGGTLVLAKTLNRTVKYITVQTSPGESAESVARRLADTINTQHAQQNERGGLYHPHWLWIGGYQVSASGSKLTLPGSPDEYITAGTETGLGIPRRPLSLSCSYNEETDEVILHWISPPGGYDYILVKSYWDDFKEQATKLINNMSTTFKIDRKKLPVTIDDMEFRVVGIRHGIQSRAAIPSNAASIHVTANGHCQEETYGIPFAGGVAPNWMSWSTEAEPDTESFEQGERYPSMEGYNPALGLLTKPFYQVIKAPPRGGAHGVYRKFLGLTPGHTYRLIACLTTMNMDLVEGNWSFSIHAAPSRSDGKELTSKQMAGLAALPDKRSGLEAGRVASYGPGNTTKGTFELVFSSENGGGPEQVSSNITLPAGVDTITVWVRFNCSDPKGQVGFSGVKLEDISAISDPKSPEEIMLKEHRQERRLLRGIEKASLSEPQSK